MKNADLVSRLDEIIELLPQDVTALAIAQRYQDASRHPRTWTMILECREHLVALRKELDTYPKQKGDSHD